MGANLAADVAGSDFCFCVSPSQRLVHDFLNGAQAAAALGAAAKAAMNPGRRTGRTLSRVAHGAHVAIGQYVAGTDDHPGGIFLGSGASGVRNANARAKPKTPFLDVI
jgi:hypothetical protein